MQAGAAARRMQYSSCDECRRSRVLCDAMSRGGGGGAVSDRDESLKLPSCTRCQRRHRPCTFKVCFAREEGFQEYRVTREHGLDPNSLWIVDQGRQGQDPQASGCGSKQQRKPPSERDALRAYVAARPPTAIPWKCISGSRCSGYSGSERHSSDPDISSSSGSGSSSPLLVDSRLGGSMWCHYAWAREPFCVDVCEVCEVSEVLSGLCAVS